MKRASGFPSDPGDDPDDCLENGAGHPSMDDDWPPRPDAQPQRFPVFREPPRWLGFWKREPLPPPSDHLELTPDNWIERGAEVIGWSLARLEYWLSRSGWLRAWLRLALWLTIVLAAAGFLLLPAATGVLAGIADSAHWLATIVVSLTTALASLPPAVISVAFLYLVFVFGRRHYLRRRQRGRGPYDDERYYQ
jgi:hypothetical protein